jgi:hypothetical protein
MTLGGKAWELRAVRVTAGDTWAPFANGLPQA